MLPQKFSILRRDKLFDTDLSLYKFFLPGSLFRILVYRVAFSLAALVMFLKHIKNVVFDSNIFNRVWPFLVAVGSLFF